MLVSRFGPGILRVDSNSSILKLGIRSCTLWTLSISTFVCYFTLTGLLNKGMPKALELWRHIENGMKTHTHTHSLTHAVSSRSILLTCWPWAMRCTDRNQDVYDVDEWCTPFNHVLKTCVFIMIKCAAHISHIFYTHTRFGTHYLKQTSNKHTCPFLLHERRRW